MRQNYSHNK